MSYRDRLVSANDNIQALVLEEVIQERVRQDGLFGPSPRNLEACVWLAVLLEELGEVSRAILESDSSNYRDELLQVAACAITALEDYHSGTPSINLKDVGCSINYSQSP